MKFVIRTENRINMDKKLLITGSVLGLLAVILGAFAAHGLEKIVDTKAIETFKTGVRYQMYHALLLLVLAGLTKLTLKTKKVILYLVIFGVILFSGSIYGLSTNILTGFDFKQIGFVTPLGGLLLIMAWSLMLLKFIKLKED